MPAYNRPHLLVHLLLGFTTNRGIALQSAILPLDQAGLPIAGQRETRGNRVIVVFALQDAEQLQFAQIPAILSQISPKQGTQASQRLHYK